MNKNKIDHPDYYNPDKLETIDVIESLGPEYAKGFEMGCVIKYFMRAGKKPNESELRDLEKASWYLNRYINYLKKRETEEEKSVKEEKVSKFKIGDMVQFVYNYRKIGKVINIFFCEERNVAKYVVHWNDDTTTNKNYGHELILFNDNKGRKNED